jgi:hypothetical protein
MLLIVKFLIWGFIVASYLFNVILFIDYKETYGLKSKDIAFHMIFLLLAPFVVTIRIIMFFVKRKWR